MAGVSYFNFSEKEFDSAVPPPPRSADQPHFTFDIDHLYHQDRNFHRFSHQDSFSITTADSFDRGNQVNFVMDLFQERVEQSHVMGAIDFGDDDELESSNLELDFGLEVGFGVYCDDDDDDEIDDDDGVENLGSMVGESVNNYIGDRRRAIYLESEIESDDGLSSSTVCAGSEQSMTGLGVIGFESDSDIDGGDNNLLDVSLHGDDSFGLDHDDGTSVDICWDALQLEENHREDNEDFEWQEVDGGIDFLGVLDPQEERRVSISVSQENQSDEEVNVERVNLGWEVLLTTDNLEGNRELEELDPYFAEPDDYIHTTEYEMLFGQFTENENAAIWRPPASKCIVENLGLIDITHEDEANNNTLCAVCKDEMNVGETAKQLPCLHKYHGECIIPWLCIRNTCPVCRHELPTDDADYEHRRNQRATGLI